MSPISRERAEFISKRIKVLVAMYQELLMKPNKYIDRGQHDLHAAVLTNIRAEKIQLEIELEVLNNAIAAQEANNGSTS